MIHNIWLLVEPYVYVPSAVYVVLTLFVYMMWLFGTDWYDRFNKLWYNSLDFMKAYFFWTVVINAIGFMFTDYVIYGLVAWNLWCSLVLIVYGVRLAHYLLHSFNTWCLIKRGKK